MSLPHAIGPWQSPADSSTTGGGNTSSSHSSSGELGIGGLSVAYGTADPVEWTRAMKYLLTNVKWLVAYTAKHVDR